MVRICFVNSSIRTTESARQVPFGIAQLAALADQWGAEVGLEDVNIRQINVNVMTKDMVDEEKSWGD